MEDAMGKVGIERPDGRDVTVEMRWVAWGGDAAGRRVNEARVWGQISVSDLCSFLCVIGWKSALKQKLARPKVWERYYFM
jgi:hypothetical protein